MSSNFETKTGARSPGVNRGRDGNFAERIGRDLKSAADLLARLGQAGAAATSARVPESTHTLRDANGQWDPEAVVAHIAARAAKFLGSDTIDPDADFFDLGGTSVNAVALVDLLSRELGISLSLDDLFSDARPRRLAEYWLKQLGAVAPVPIAASIVRVASPSVSTSAAAQALRSPYADEDRRAIEADLELANGLPWVDPPPLAAPRRILLTGATGFLGSQMLFDLLRRSDAHVVCLVRAKDDAAARDRLIHELEKRDLPWSAELERRVSVLAGDIQQPQLGWDAHRWHAQAQEIDSVVHVAAAVDFLRGYQSLRRSNVLGALTMAEFASSVRVKPLHHVSTISVFDELGIRSMGEDDPPAHVDRLFAGYEKTKWAAEAVLRRARDRGLRVSFYRPGGIGGHTVTGVYNPQDLSSGFMAAWQALRALPEFRTMHVAPVDWVSRICCELVLDPESWGYNYNLTGTPLDLRTVARNMALGGMNMRVMSFEQWRACFRERMQRD
ncbi:MAG TPA: thioester reductase domain-containing protein, partial [Polyangiales bacterium]